MENKKFLLITLGVALVIALGVFVYVSKKHPAKPVYKEVKSTTTQAPAGKVVEGFPQELAGKTTAVDKSYAVSYENGLDQFSTESISSFSTIKAAFDYYVKILQDQKYVFIDKTLTDTMGHIYAENRDGNADVSVTITKQNGKVNVAASYLKK